MGIGLAERLSVSQRALRSMAMVNLLKPTGCVMHQQV